MRIDDLNIKGMNNDLPFDVVDDVQFHMVNDTAFYRKQYFPFMDKIKNDLIDDASFTEKLIPLIDRAVSHYCMKYDMPQAPEDLLSKEEKMDLANNIIEYEKESKEKKSDEITGSI